MGAKQPVKEYVLKNAKAHCKSHYVKKTKTVKKHSLVKVRKTVCVYQAPKAKANPKAVTPPTIKTVHLHAHLDPSFVQDPTDPLHVTYSYSATATATLGTGPETAEPNLPLGILTLYSDGLLACSFEVGGTTTGGETTTGGKCPVTYSAFGTHTVVVTYSSGAGSTTETYTEHITPIPVAATTATGSSATHYAHVAFWVGPQPLP